MVSASATIPSSSYVAVLKAKQGEMLAAAGTPARHFIALFEVIDLSKAAQIARAWPHANDVSWIQSINLAGTDDQAWADETEALFATLRSEKRAPVPVVTLGETAETLAAVAAIHGIDGRGIVLRLDCEEILEETPAGLASAISTVLSSCGVSDVDVDLVIDAGLVDGGPAVQSGVVVAALALVPNVPNWRNIVTAFSAFPAVVGDVVATSTVGSIPRVDSAAYTHLASRWTQRELIYADYGVGVPTYADVPFSPVPNIRYAVAGEWVVHRAATRRDPSPQYVQPARDVAGAHYFSGPGFSPGDQYIDDVANGVDGPGNAGSYLRAAMSRHFYVVLDSLATHGAP